MQTPKQYNESWYKTSCGPLFSDKNSDWLYYKRTAEFACENLDKKSLVLEVGCGLGILSYRLSSHCGRVIGIDISEYACVKARALYPVQQINFVVADAQNLPFKPEIFDAAVVSHLFEHLGDQEATTAQQEIYRVLKVKSALTIEQPIYNRSITDIIFLYLFSSPKNKNLYYYTNKAIKEVKKKYPEKDWYHLEGIGNPTHKRLYDIELLVRELKAAGFHKFRFYRRKLFRILFFNSKILFHCYILCYLTMPSAVRRIICISPNALIKAVKL
jgi:ubiquinone/menaquinone biosynthesis C-methylase UbiE